MKRRTLIRIVSGTIAAFAIVAGFAVKYYNETKVYRRAEIYAGYMAMTELADAAEEMSRAFEAGAYAYSPQVLASLSNAIWHHSAVAVEALSRLPLYDAQIEQTRTFIARAGDYAAYLSRAAATQMPDETQRAALREMGTAAATLSEKLRAVEGDVYAGNVLFSGAIFDNNGAVFRFGDMEEAGEYPSPEYDGVYAQAYVERVPAALVDTQPCSRQQAETYAAKILGCNSSNLDYLGESGGTINCHIFTDGDSEIYITTNGGMIAQLHRSPTVDAAVMEPVTYDPARLSEMAAQALSDFGYENMESIETTYADDSISAVFVCAEDGVRCYPDEIHVTYAPGQGITSLDAAAYLMNHHARDLTAPASIECKADILPPELDAQFVATVVIDSGYGTEVLCREYAAQTETGKTIRLFCDAVTGAQCKIEIED